MERDKIIEEIATCFCGYYDDENDKCKFYLHRPLCKETDCHYRCKATDIVNKYIPDGAVVLTAEERKEQAEKQGAVVRELVKAVEEKAVKETAREILSEFLCLLELIKDNNDAKVLLNHIEMFGK